MLKYNHSHKACVSTMLYCVFSGMTAVICTYPLDVVRARLAFQVTGEHRYTGIANAFHTIYLKVVFSFSNTQHSLHKYRRLSLKMHKKQMICFWFSLQVFVSVVNNVLCIYFIQSHLFFFFVKEGGVLGFYRGLTPTLIGMAPYAGDYWDYFA